MNVFILPALAICAFVLAFAPRWRDKFRWGRGVDNYPATRSGCLLLAAALVVMAAGLAAQYLELVEDPIGFCVLLAGFVLLLVAGLLDRPKH